jgi:hypothetical protein
LKAIFRGKWWHGSTAAREADRRIRLIERLAACFDDHRDPALVRHPVQEMVAQRV